MNRKSDFKNACIAYFIGGQDLVRGLHDDGFVTEDFTRIQHLSDGSDWYQDWCFIHDPDYRERPVGSLRRFEEGGGILFWFYATDHKKLAGFAKKFGTYQEC